DPPVLRMSLVNAELAKLAINTFVTMKVSFANMLGQLCERLEEGDADMVSKAVGLDSRIGSKYLKAGLGYGGPCFPRDNRALVALARQLEVPAFLPQATDRVNRQQLHRLKNLVLQDCPKNGRVGVLGLTYKPDTPVLEGAQGLELATMLLEENVSVVAYDPLVDRLPEPILADKLPLANSVLDCAKQVDVLVICLPCKEFAALQDYRLSPRDFR